MSGSGLVVGGVRWGGMGCGGLVWGGGLKGLSADTGPTEEEVGGDPLVRNTVA